MFTQKCELMASGRTGAFRLIARTAHAAQRDRTRFLKEGVNGFLPKQFKADGPTEALGNVPTAKSPP